MIKSFLYDLIKIDTLLAFIVATSLQYIYTQNMKLSLNFSLKFVIIFLIILNILKLLNINTL